MSGQTCSYCRWWTDSGHYNPGACNRYPPTVRGGGEHNQFRPRTWGHDMCGEFTPKPATENPSNKTA